MWATTYSPYQLCPGLCTEEDTPASPHIKTSNAGKLRRLQKFGYEKYIGKCSLQLVYLACGYWFWHYFGSITQTHAWSISETARAAGTVYLDASLTLMSLKHPKIRELPVNHSSVLSIERDGRKCGCQEAHFLAIHRKTESVC